MGYRLLLSLLLSCMPVQLWAEPVRLTTLEWPPYTSQSLPDGGLTGHIVKRAFAEAGLEVTFDFYPWQRAVRLAADPTQPYSGYFPEYLSDTLPTLWRSSASVGDSVLGMAQRSGPPIPWQQLTDLAPYRIGVVEGYVNTREFDALMASKRLNTAAVDADLLNLRKLQRDRLDLAVIDRDVFHWLINHDRKLSSAGLQFHPKILEHKSLHIMFRPDQQALQQRVAKAIARLDIAKLSEDYQRRYLQQAPAAK
ncbi:substrate-binding periplasmic protein [Aeromonas veronii]|uniref:substrate-binding periplasmic protein n=1 Tax=Aeromonas veronii TaxID=654 RepID=UPI00142FB63F|nr:transporter substrate-binding domain-containing protein [Aeromonas veronii]NJI17665.1 ABC transporter substrate-binding protein [Aeromonas veronii]